MAVRAAAPPGHLRRWLLLAGGVLAVFLLASQAASALQSSVQNGHVRVGVNDQAVLGIVENPPSSTTGLPSSSGSPYTNIRDMTTDNDANGNFGSAYNVWGIAYDTGLPTSAYACAGPWGACPGPPSIPWAGAKTLASSGSCGSPATACTVAVCDTRLELRVCHDFHASPNTDLVEVTVTLESLRPAASGPIHGVQYRRSMILSPEPVAAAYANTRPLQHSHIQLEGIMPVPPSLVWSSDNGYNQNGPTYTYGPTGPVPSTCPTATNPTAFVPAEPAAPWWTAATGPCVHGALYEFNFGDILIGSPVKFKMWLGAAPTKTAAEADMGAIAPGVGADFWALAMHPSDPTGGSPDTFIWGFGGLRPPTAAMVVGHPPPPPSPPFTSTDLCVGVAASFTDTSTPGGWPLTSVKWTFGDGSPPVVAAPGATVAHTYTVVGTYIVTLLVADSAGRTTTLTQPVIVYDCTVPAANFTLPAILCATREGTYTDTTPAGPYPYARSRWIWGDGSQDTVLDPYATTAKHTYAQAATLTLTLEVTNSIGIVGSRSVIIAPCNIICPSFGYIPLQVAAEGQAFMLDVTATDANGPSLAIAGYGPRGSTLAPASAGGPGPWAVSSTFSWTPAPHSAGAYRIVLTATDGLCDVTHGFSLRVQGNALDTDLDGIDDRSDNCPATPNHEQQDFDHDGIGDACQAMATPIMPHTAPPNPASLPNDRDGDSILDGVDNCPSFANRDQADLDKDGIGDGCDSDADGDGVADRAFVRGAVLDNCPGVPNADQADRNGDGVGDACSSSVTSGTSGAGPQAAPASLGQPGPDPVARWAFFGISFVLGLGFLGFIFTILTRRGRT